MKRSGSRASTSPRVHPSRTEYNTDPHGKYALLVSAAANIDIRVIREAESGNGKPEELARATGRQVRDRRA